MAIRVGRLEVETADHVVLRYTLAGVGNRGFAAVVDFLVALLITAGLEIGYGQIGAPGDAALGGLIRLVLFVLGWSYFILLEWLWNGQTIGKRAYGLRVINEDGSPAGFVAVFVRNLVRMVDFLPSFYGLGLLSIVFTSRSQRLGDLAAGTFVVRAPKPQLDWLSLRTVTRAGAPVPAAGVRGLSGEAQRIVREFVAREGTLSARDRARLATEIALRIRPYIAGIDASDDVAFLRAVAATLREAGGAAVVNEIVGIIILVLLIAGFTLLTGGGRSASELRMRRRWESNFESEIRRVRPTDATGALMCRRCGASGSERAGRCRSCGAVL